MAFKLLPRTRELTDTVGTGAINLTGAAATNVRTFGSQMSEGDTTYACALSSDATTWEEGFYTLTSGDLVRTSIIANSAGTTSAVSLTGGQIFGVIPHDLLGALAKLLTPTDGDVITYSSGAFIAQAPAGGGTSARFHDACELATTGALAANTYANGTAGVGATLTANANGAIANIDGIAVLAGYRILVKNEATGAHNGVYVATQVGDGSHPYILTRATDFDEVANIGEGDPISVGAAGVTNALTLWQFYTAGAITIGTTSLNFARIGIRGSEGLDLTIGATPGDIPVRGATAWGALAIGSAGDVLTVNGTADGYLFAPAAGGGGSGDVSYADFEYVGVFSDTGSYAPGQVVTGDLDGSDYLNKIAVDASLVTSAADSWDTSFGSTKWSVSGLTATAVDHNHIDTIIGTKAQSTGKRIIEFTAGSTSEDRYIGIAPATIANNATRLSDASAGVGFRNDGAWRFNGSTTASGIGAIPSGHKTAVIFDLDNGKGWVSDATAAPGVWWGNGSIGDPTAGTNGFPFTPFANAHVAACSNQNGTDQAFVYQDGSGTITSPIPLGVAAWGGVNGHLLHPSADTTNWAKVSTNVNNKSVDTLLGSTTNFIPLRTAGGWLGKTLSQILDAAAGSTRGNILARGASSWGVVTPGTAGQFLALSSTIDPIWEDNAGGGSPNPTIVQAAASVGSTSAVTFGVAPTQGNLLLAMGTHWNNPATTNAGWTQLSNTNGVTFDGQVTAQKVAAASESTTQTPFNVSGGSSTVVLEIANAAGAPSLMSSLAENTGSTLTLNSINSPSGLVVGAFAVAASNYDYAITGATTVDVNVTSTTANNSPRRTKGFHVTGATGAASVVATLDSGHNSNGWIFFIP